MSLTERIERRKPAPPPEPIGNRRPVWIQRMLDQGLPVQDRTSYLSDGCGPTGRAA